MLNLVVLEAQFQTAFQSGWTDLQLFQYCIGVPIFLKALQQLLLIFFFIIFPQLTVILALLDLFVQKLLILCNQNLFFFYPFYLLFMSSFSTGFHF